MKSFTHRHKERTEEGERSWKWQSIKKWERICDY